MKQITILMKLIANTCAISLPNRKGLTLWSPTFCKPSHNKHCSRVGSLACYELWSANCWGTLLWLMTYKETDKRGQMLDSGCPIMEFWGMVFHPLYITGTLGTIFIDQRFHNSHASGWRSENSSQWNVQKPLGAELISQSLPLSLWLLYAFISMASLHL